MSQPGLSPLWSSHYYGNVSAGPAICRPRWQVLPFNWLLAKDSSNNSCVLLSGIQTQTHCPTMKRTSNINVFKLNHPKCYLKNFLSALSQGFKKLPQTSHQHGEVRPGESSPPLLSHSLCVCVCVSLQMFSCQRVIHAIRCSLCRLILCSGCWVLVEGWTLTLTRRTGTTETDFLI